ncbi:MAG: TerB family tellurite resistance protein [Rhodobacteraceae bacterium]|nr:TerB family tellurite resistance protein [Paracoccaceae bacterium]
MLDTLLKFLSNPQSEPSLKPADARIALTALLVRVARADHHYARSEIAVIQKILCNRYGLSDTEAEQLRCEAEELEAAAPDMVRFTKAVKDAVPLEERAVVVEALWQVALADGHRDHEEEGLLRLVVNLLGINDRDSGLARQRVITGLAAKA